MYSFSIAVRLQVFTAVTVFGDEQASQQLRFHSSDCVRTAREDTNMCSTFQQLMNHNVLPSQDIPLLAVDNG